MVSYFPALCVPWLPKPSPPLPCLTLGWPAALWVPSAGPGLSPFDSSFPLRPRRSLSSERQTESTCLLSGTSMSAGDWGLCLWRRQEPLPIHTPAFPVARPLGEIQACLPPFSFSSGSLSTCTSSYLIPEQSLLSHTPPPRHTQKKELNDTALLLFKTCSCPAFRMLFGEQVSYLPQVWGKPRCGGRLQQVTCPRCRREMSVRWLAPGGSPGPEKAPGKDRALCLGAHCYAATAVCGQEEETHTRKLKNLLGSRLE